MLLCVSIFSNSWAAEGDDPFGAGADGKGAPVKVDLLRAAKQAAARKKVEQELKRERLLRLNQHRLETLLAKGRATEANSRPDDAYVLEINLSELHSARIAAFQEQTLDEQLTNHSEPLAALVKQNWYRLKDESPREMFARIKSSSAQDGVDVPQAIKELHQSIENLGGDKSRTWADWREEEAFWLGLLETIEEAKRSDEPNTVFRRSLPEGNVGAGWYRLAYLHFAQYVRNGRFDLNYVEPLLATKSDRALVVRLCAALSAMPKVRGEAEEATYQELQARLAAVFKRVETPDQLAFKLAATFPANSDYLPYLEDWMLHSLSAYPVAALVKKSNASPEEARRFMLGRHVEVKFAEVPLNDAISELKEEAPRFPVWLDVKVRKDKSPLTFAASGSWLDVLDLALEKTPYRASLLGSRVLWIGDPNDLPRAEQLLSRVPPGRNRIADVLLGPSAGEFVETPLRDVVEYFKDAHDVQIFMLEQYDRPVTMNSRELFLSVLTTATHAAGCDWLATEELLVVGTPERLADFRKQQDRQLRREIATRGQMAELLQEITHIEFIETPLEAVAGYLSDVYNAKFHVLGDQQTAITMNLKGMPLATTLSLMAISHGLDWDCDDQTIVIGPPEKLAQFKQVTRDRQARKKLLPAETYEKLQQVMTLEFVRTPLVDVLKSLSDATTLKIQAGESLRLTQPITLHAQNLPLDTQLELLCAAHGLKWSIEKDQILIEPAKQAD